MAICACLLQKEAETSTTAGLCWEGDNIAEHGEMQAVVFITGGWQGSP